MFKVNINGKKGSEDPLSEEEKEEGIGRTKLQRLSYSEEECGAR